MTSSVNRTFERTIPVLFSSYQKTVWSILVHIKNDSQFRMAWFEPEKSLKKSKNLKKMPKNPSDTLALTEHFLKNVLSNELLKVIIVSLMVNREYCPILSRIMFVPLLRYRPLWRKWLIPLFYMQIMLRVNSELKSIHLLFFHQVVLITLFI